MFLISYKKDNFNAKKSYKNYYYNAKLGGGHHNDTKQKKLRTITVRVDANT